MKLYLPSCSSFTLWLLVLHYIFVKRHIKTNFIISRPESLKSVFLPVFYSLFAEQTSVPISCMAEVQLRNAPETEEAAQRGIGCFGFSFRLEPFPKCGQVISSLPPSEISKQTISRNNLKAH